MSQNVNMVVNVPSRGITATIFNGTNLPYESVLMCEPISEQAFYNKTIIDSTNDVAANKLNINGQISTIGSATPLPGSVLVYVSDGLVDFLPNTLNTVVISVAGKSGVVVLNSSDVGLGNVNNTSDLNKPLSTAAIAALALKLDTANLGLPNFAASLDGTGKIPVGQLPSVVFSSIVWKGLWNVATNTPAIPVAAVGNNGWMYKVSVAGTSSITGTLETYILGDELISNGTSWEHILNYQSVSSVAGKTGTVVLVPADVGLGNVNNTSDANKPLSTATVNALTLKVNYTDVIDSLLSTETAKPLSANQGRVLDQSKVSISSIVNNLLSTDQFVPLSAAMGNALSLGKINTTAIINDLTTGGATNVLSAQQGLLLNTGKINVSAIVDNLVTGGSANVLSAQQGVTLNNSKINTSAIINDLVTGGTTNVLSAQQGVALNAAKINVSAIINDLVTGGATNVLSAQQGLILNGISATKINVSAIINDLTTGGTTNVLSAQQGITLNTLISGKINTTAIINDLTTGGVTNVLSAQQGITLNLGKISTSAIVNDLITGGIANVLSAQQGVTLNTNKINFTDIVNDLVTGGTTKVLSAQQGVTIATTLSNKINVSAIVDNLITGGSANVLSAQQGVVLNAGKINFTDIINDLTTGGAAKVLSAQQGVALNAAKINITAIINDLVTGGASNVLSAQQGLTLNVNKINFTDIINDLTTGGVAKVLSAQQGVVLNTNKINTSAIINDMTTGGTTNVLSAQQGVVIRNDLLLYRTYHIERAQIAAITVTRNVPAVIPFTADPTAGAINDGWVTDPSGYYSFPEGGIFMVQTGVTFASTNNPNDNAFKLRLETYNSINVLVSNYVLNRIDLPGAQTNIKPMFGARQIYVGTGQKMRILVDFTGSSGPASMLTTGVEDENWLNISKLGPFGPITL